MTQLTKNIYAVEVPKDAEKLQLTNIQVDTDLVYIDGDGIIRYVDSLPEGQWSFICTSSDISEQQAHQLVGHHGGFFKDYTHKTDEPKHTLKTALESFSSLLKSKGLTDGCWAILRKQ